jgi:hypothetical protein
MNVSKMGDLHYTLTLDTDPVERKLKIIGKHLTAMADELELAKQLEGMDFKVHSACEPTSASVDIVELADAVVKRLRDCFGLEV